MTARIQKRKRKLRDAHAEHSSTGASPRRNVNGFGPSEYEDRNAMSTVKVGASPVTGEAQKLTRYELVSIAVAVGALVISMFTVIRDELHHRRAIHRQEPHITARVAGHTSLLSPYFFC